MLDFLKDSAAQMAEYIKQRKISSEELVKAHLEHIQKINPKINALTQAFDPNECLKKGRQADELVRSKSKLGKLHGVPLTFKDCLQVKGLICSCANKSLYGKTAREDATLVKRMKDEGAIVLGITNVPELTMSNETDNSIYGRTNNPYDLKRTSGGSSGGCAALIAAGGSPLSIASDSGGSIRWPSACTGIAGLKPTLGLVPITGNTIGTTPGIFSRVLAYGPLSRHVEDLFLALSIMAGPDGKDPNCLPRQTWEHTPKELKEVRVAYYTDDGFATPTKDIQETVRNASLALKKSVQAVEENRSSCLVNSYKLLWETVFLGGDRGEGIKTWLKYLGSLPISPLLDQFIKSSENCTFSVADLRMRLVETDQFRNEMLSFMDPYDILLTPVVATNAKPHGTGLKEIRDFSYVMAPNLTGWPAAVVRCGTSKEGLPIGVQIIGKSFEDLLVLKVAKHLENIFGGWRPPNNY